MEDKVWQINKVLAGKASLPEKRKLQKWIRESDQHQKQFEEIKALWELPQSTSRSQTSRDPYADLFKIRTAVERRQVAAKKKKMILKLLIAFLATCLLLFVFFKRNETSGSVSTPKRQTTFLNSKN